MQIKNILSGIVIASSLFSANAFAIRHPDPVVNFPAGGYSAQINGEIVTITGQQQKVTFSIQSVQTDDSAYCAGLVKRALNLNAGFEINGYDLSNNPNPAIVVFNNVVDCNIVGGSLQ